MSLPIHRPSEPTIIEFRGAANVDRELFDLELERVRLRAMLAIEKESEAAARMRAELDQLAGVLEQLRPRGRMRVLAQRLALEPDDVELVWSTVAVNVDPHVVPHAQVFSGSDAR